MLSKKIKKEFLIAVPENPGWYQVLSEQELAHSSPQEKSPERYIPVVRAFTFSASTPSYFLDQALPWSPGIWKEVAEITAAEILKQPEVVQKAVSHFEEAELSARDGGMDLDVGERLFIEHGAETFDKLLNSLEFLRSLPDEAYKFFPDREVANSKAAYAMNDILKDTEKGATDKQSLLANVLTTQISKRTMIGFFEETKASINVADMLMRHWGEVSGAIHRESYDGFTVGYRPASVYLRRNFTN